nr:hypothetical protein [Tanacetum cinerariifolium]
MFVEQPVKRGNHNIQSLQNFRVVHKRSISLNTSQISLIHTIAPILSTKEPEHLLSMGKCEDTSEDEIECDMPANDDCSPIFTTFSNPPFKNDDLDSSDDEIADTIVESIPSLLIVVQDGDSQREEIDVVTKTDDVLPPSVENDDDSSDDPLLEEADLFLASDISIPPESEDTIFDPGIFD